VAFLALDNKLESLKYQILIYLYFIEYRKD